VIGALAVAIRVAHIAATCTSFGGLFYARMVLLPAVDELPEVERKPFLDGVIRRFAVIKWTGVVVVAVTGIVQLVAVWPMVASPGAYLAAFAFYAVVYAFDVDLLPSAFAVGLFSTLLAVEVFREAEADAYRALVFSAVVGIVVGEARWALYFLPLEGFLAAILLLLVFYQATGLIQHHLTGHLNRTIVTEFSLVTTVGLAVVIVGRVLDLG
jgi:hypothetical protein